MYVNAAGLESARMLPAACDDGASDEAERSEPPKPGLSEQIRGLHSGITLPLLLVSHWQRSSTDYIHTACSVYTQIEKQSPDVPTYEKETKLMKETATSIWDR